MKKINNFTKEYAFLSNFYECPVCYHGLRFSSSEAAFQAEKCENDNERHQFCSLSAGHAKQLGRQVKIRNDWEDIKVNVMREIVMAKFIQNEDLRTRLLTTGDAYLEEGNTWGDRLWGTVDGNGRNLLGQILMETRNELMYQNIIDFSNDRDR